MRRPPHGGRRVECANRERRSAAAMACVSERISAQLSRESRSAIRSETHSIAAARRVSRCARAVRRPPTAVVAWRARVAKCAAPQQWRVVLNTSLSSSRARAVQDCVQKCMPLLRRCTFRN
eukprot:10412017-Lingulodinium_polyedra.AAC.1